MIGKKVALSNLLVGRERKEKRESTARTIDLIYKGGDKKAMDKMKQERPSTYRRKSGMRIEVPASNNLENRIAVSNDVKVLLVDENSVRGYKYQLELLTCTFCACRIADLPISAGYCRYRIGKSKVLPIISAIGNRQFRGLPISYRRRYRTGKIGKSANRQQP